MLRSFNFVEIIIVDSIIFFFINTELNEAELTSAKKELEDAISPELWSIIEVLSNLKSSDPAALPIEIEVTEMSKEKRTQIHKVLKKLYTGKLVSTTVNTAPNNLPDDSIEGKKFIKILKPKGSHGMNNVTFYMNSYIYSELYINRSKS